ncbi:MAG: hypothetical protein KBD43_14230 [Saprospiraceae bacterium]|nr:hypothetical protein [Saprospiraceae bacterium]
MFELSIYSLLLWVTGVLILSFDFVIYLDSKNRSSYLFAAFSSFVALWSISYGFIVASNSSDISLYLMKVNHLLGMITSLGFIAFSISYPDNRPINSKLVILLTSIGVVFTVLIFNSKLIIPSMFLLQSPDHWGWNIGALYLLYCLTFVFLWTTILFNIRVKILSSENVTQRINQLFMFWGLAIGILPPTILNIILPYFGVYGLSWTGPISSAIWIFIIGYSIIRYRQMNVRIVITEVLAIAMTVIFFINIFIQAQFGVWENIATFLVFLLLAIFLIRGILTELRQKEELRILNNTLEDKVAEQTKEIFKAYELEKNARRELEKLNETKDQFILITQHSIRSPLNSIQGGVDEIHNSKASHSLQVGTDRIKYGVERLNKVADDFLAITAIKSSSKILNLEKYDLRKIIEEIIEILNFEIKEKNITISVFFDNKPILLYIDPSKIYEALLIVIENAIKYNNHGGSIDISGKFEFDTLVLDINDNGNGISKEDMDKISHNLFHRGTIARQMNPIGMGVGLHVARSIIRAHHGELTIESDGEGKGTNVTISLPFNFLEQNI